MKKLTISALIGLSLIANTAVNGAQRGQSDLDRALAASRQSYHAEQAGKAKKPHVKVQHAQANIDDQLAQAIAASLREEDQKGHAAANRQVKVGQPKADSIYRINNTTIELVVGDITKQPVQAVVNAAKEELTGGGGVDGAIHDASGPQLLKHILTHIPANRDGVRCPIGQARVTPGFKLPAPCIIHAVGPTGHNPKREALLNSAYQAILSAKNPATNKPFDSVAIPSISTGIYGFPRELAAQIVVQSVIGQAWANDTAREIRFVFFNDFNGQQGIELYKKEFRNFLR